MNIFKYHLKDFSCKARYINNVLAQSKERKNIKRKRKRAILIAVLTHYQRPRGKSTQWNFLFENNAKCFRQREILSGAELLNTWNRGINHTQFYLFSSHCHQPSSVKSTISHPIGKSIAFWLLLAIRIDQPVFQFSSTNPTTPWSLLNLVCVGCHSKSLVFGNQERSRHQSLYVFLSS